MARIILLLGLLLWGNIVRVNGQASSKWDFKGYLKDMSSFNYFGDSLWYENLIHNRLKLVWYPSQEFTFRLEVRNRMFVGDFVKNIPAYGKIIDSSDDFFTLSGNLVDNGSVIINTAVDRAFVTWNKDNWEIKAGRQRINWGVNLAWNPNDWFNAYSFFDFDYEERPGSDAIRVSYYTGVASSVEIAAKLADNVDKFVGAVMWRTNKWNYDIQWLGGLAQGDLSLGSGWAGNIGNAGFKGELSLFIPVIDTPTNAGYSSLFLGAISMDYSFKNSLSLNGSLMYNSNGQLNPTFGFFLLNQTSGDFTVRNLSPYKWSAFVQSTYQITPLLYSGLAVMTFPGGNTLFLNPFITISAAQNLDVDVIGQVFFDEDLTGTYKALTKSFYLRVKWSF